MSDRKYKPLVVAYICQHCFKKNEIEVIAGGGGGKNTFAFGPEGGGGYGGNVSVGSPDGGGGGGEEKPEGK